MTKLLRAWRRDPRPGFVPDDSGQQDRHLSRRDLERIADSFSENEPGETPNIHRGIGDAFVP